MFEPKLAVSVTRDQRYLRTRRPLLHRSLCLCGSALDTVRIMQIKDHLSIWLKILALMVIAIAPPAIVSAILWPGAASIVAFGVMVGLIGAMTSGLRSGVRFAAIFAVASTIAVAVGSVPALAALLVAAMSALIGVFSTKGLAPPMVICAILIPYVIQAPPGKVAEQGLLSDTAVYLGATLLFIFLCGVWGAAVITRLTKKSAPQSPADSASPRYALIFGSILAISTGVLTYVAMTWFPQTFWMWLLLTIYTLSNPVGDRDRSMGRDRLTGTIAGLVAAFLILSVISNTVALYALGILIMTIALTLMAEKRPYWMFASFLTPAVVIFAAVGKSQLDQLKVGEQRLVFTLVGMVVAVLISFAVTLGTKAAMRD